MMRNLFPPTAKEISRRAPERGSDVLAFIAAAFDSRLSGTE